LASSKPPPSYGAWVNMRDTRSEFHAAGSARHQGVRLGLFVLWLGLVLFIAWHHAFWRDEVRALSLALQGENVVEMLKSVHGEGHPALWYLLLRAAYSVVGSPIVLPLVSLGVASAGALLLVLKSPFPWWMIALLLLSGFALYEYSVMARNYGLSVPLLFLLAICYPSHRDRGVLLGALLFLLASTNLHSVVLVGAFLLFWLIDTVGEYGIRWTQPLRTFLVNAAVSAAGVAACFAMIYPTFNDAAFAALPEGITLKLLARAVLLPAASFDQVSLVHFVTSAFGPLPGDITAGLISLAMFGSLLGLIRRPGAFIAALAALVVLSLFFTLVYNGGYRHQALWLVFLVTMYWITRASDLEKTGARVPVRLSALVRPASAIGSALMVLMVALQLPAGIIEIARAAYDLPPQSRARDFSAWVAARSDLQDAIIIADPDYLLEALPYYIRNRTYLMREQRFGNVVKFTRNARLALDLDDILATARTLRSQTGKPVLILLHKSLDPSPPAQIYHEGYNWTLLTTPEQVRGFLAATRFLARFAPAQSDESFDVYLLA
jgi:hypothetical protein